MFRDSRDDRLNSCIIMLHFIFIFMFIEQYKHIAILATSCVHI